MAVTESLILELSAKVDKYRADIKGAQKDTETFQTRSETSFNKVEKSTSRLNSSLSAFKPSLAAVGVSVGLVARQFAVLSEEFTGIERQIKRSETTQAGFNEKLGQLTDLSLDLGASLKSVTELYARLEFSTKELGLSEKDVLQITETLNKAFKTTGATTEEAASATLQLSQAFASGVLQGDEFRAVSESAPAVMRALATELGVTTGELKRLSSEGKITSNILSSALLKSAEDVAEEYNRVVGETRTLSEGWQNLRTGALLLVGAIDDASGASSTLGDMMSSIGESFVSASKDVGGFIDAGAALWDGRIVSHLIDVNKETSTTARLLDQVGKTISDNLNPVIDQLGDSISSGFDGYTNLAGQFANELAKTYQRIAQGVQSSSDDMLESSSVVSQAYGVILSAVGDFYKGGSQALINTANSLNEIGDDAETAANKTKTLVEQLENVGAIKFGGFLPQDIPTPLMPQPAPLRPVHTDPQVETKVTKIEEIKTTGSDKALQQLQLDAQKRIELLQKFNQIEQDVISSGQSKEIESILKTAERRTSITESSYDKQIARLKEAGESAVVVEQAKNLELITIEKEKQLALDEIAQEEIDRAKRVEESKLEAQVSAATSRVNQIIQQSEALAPLFASETDIMRQKHVSEQEELERFFQQKLITEKEYIKASEALKNTQSSNELKLAKNMFEGVLSQASSGNKRLFEINKIYSASQAALKVPEIAQNSYAFGSAFGGPVAGAAMAAIGTAAAIANVQSIMSSSYGGGSSSSSSSGGSASVSPTSSTPEVEQLPEIGVSISDIGDGGAVNTQRIIISTSDGVDIFDGLSTEIQNSISDGRT